MVQAIEEDARVDRITEHEQDCPVQFRRKKRLHVGSCDPKVIERRGHAVTILNRTQTCGLFIASCTCFSKLDVTQPWGSPTEGTMSD
ncbi:hypothetical protein BDZ89DRAFT_1067244, partial [Hymenopellis radicata]